MRSMLWVQAGLREASNKGRLHLRAEREATVEGNVPTCTAVVGSRARGTHNIDRYVGIRSLESWAYEEMELVGLNLVIIRGPGKLEVDQQETQVHVHAQAEV